MHRSAVPWVPALFSNRSPVRSTTCCPYLRHGQISSILGSVIMVTFPEGLPGLHEALKVTDGQRVVFLEVEHILGPNAVRTIALGPVIGLSRGLAVERTGAPIHVPVGPATLGRVFNALGEPIDGGAPSLSTERWPIHRPAPLFEDRRSTRTFLETGIKAIDLLPRSVEEVLRVSLAAPASARPSCSRNSCEP